MESARMAATALNSTLSLCRAPQDLPARQTEAPQTVQAASFQEKETPSALFVRADTSVQTRNTRPFPAKSDILLLHRALHRAPYVRLVTGVQMPPKCLKGVKPANMLQPQVSTSVLTVLLA